MLSPPPLWHFFRLKKGGGDLERHFDLQPISAKKGGGPKVPYFFISQEKFNFSHFFEKLELVSKIAVFFPVPEKKKQPPNWS